MMIRIVFVILFLAMFGQVTNGLAKRPNILWLSAEDISPHIGCYGDSKAITPNLDRLAKQGVLYTHAFTTAGVCAPCRSGIITGMYQTTIGTHHMRCNAKLPEFVKPFPIYLREAGYYCTNNSKTDYQFSVPKQTWDASSSNAHWKNRSSDQPFFAVFNFTGCHESGIAGERKYRSVTKNLKPLQRQDPVKLELPPYYPDTPIVREDWKRNYELITAMDKWVGAHLRALRASGEADNTIVFFWSDHGVGLPRAKRWLYDSGTRIPLIVRIPEIFRASSQGLPGTFDQQLISSIDFAPTVLKLAGLAVPDYMQGRAFLGNQLKAHREYVYGARDRMDERYDIIRMVRGKRFRYIRNYEPLKPYYQYMNTPEKGATMKEIRRLEKSGSLLSAARLFSAKKKPIEELYDLQNDPHEIRNLSDNPDYIEQLKKMRRAHYSWVRETRDIGLLPEAEIIEREALYGSRYEILRQKDSSSIMMRLGETAALASSGKNSLPMLLRAINDTDAAVRYWGVIGIGNIAPRDSVNALFVTRKLLSDSSASVRIAAGRAMARMGKPEESFPVLKKALAGTNQWARLQAAIVLDEMETQGRPLIPELKKALNDQPNKYIVRVANRALNDLLNTNNEVR
ncbi:MAG: sulfatase-like hydrolase/transferase [Verrucomicrobiota bacterium]|jgi:uncharacterized sulfatase|nr:sulfatase-like hydrolase/transferase [Verrucomicrobiota bacterium]